MNLINLIYNNKLDEALDIIKNRLQEIINKRLDETKQYIAADLLFESSKNNNSNIIRQGRITRIRMRIRRDKKGKVIVQRNHTRSSMKGYYVMGRSVKRMSAISRMNRRIKLKRSWKTTRRSKLNRSLLKRKISMRRRNSLGIK